MASLLPLSLAAAEARRDLRQQEMERFAAEMPWLVEPELIPESAVSFDGPRQEFVNPFFRLAAWMTVQFDELSGHVQDKLDYDAAFDKHHVPEEEQAKVRISMREEAYIGYGVGLQAVAETVSCVPPVATRDGKPKNEWDDITAKAKLFGNLMAHDGSDVTALIRDYLVIRKRDGSLDGGFSPSRMKLDERTGITSVTPIKDILAEALRIKKKLEPKEGYHGGECMALVAIPHQLGRQAVFSLGWDAFRVASGAHIFPHIDPAKLGQIPEQGPPDPDLRGHIKHLANLVISEAQPHLGTPPTYIPRV